jgi:hypothetical protein
LAAKGSISTAVSGDILFRLFGVPAEKLIIVGGVEMIKNRIALKGKKAVELPGRCGLAQFDR